MWDIRVKIGVGKIGVWEGTSFGRVGLGPESGRGFTVQ